MTKESLEKARKKTRLKCFEVKGIQLSIAVLTVLTLLAGMTLQVASAAAVRHYGLSSYVFSIFLIAGYAVIVIVFSMFFTHRLVGPFKRLEHETKLILKGDIARRLSSRKEDDLHLRGFIMNLNECISRHEEINVEYNRLSGLVSGKLGEIEGELSKEKPYREKVKKELKALQRELRESREKRAGR
ncbi:MAG: hypothetical protein HZB82_03320 [Deltaproteobacteria bacterium]|nr:hypothetical protein [Deltaproteobacteria bacterium]